MKKQFLFLYLLVAVNTTCTKKNEKETNSLTESLSEIPPPPPPPPACLDSCHITASDIYGDLYDFLVFGDERHNLFGKLTTTQSGPPPYDLTYTSDGKLATCRGEAVTPCWKNDYFNVFTYDTDNRLKSIISYRYRSGGGCPGPDPMNGMYYAVKCDFAYSGRLTGTGFGNMLEYHPITTVTVSESEWVNTSQFITSYTPTGETYYYEFDNGKLIIKRYKPDNSQFIQTQLEYRYFYNAGNLSLIEFSEAGSTIIKYKYTFTAYDNKKNIFSGDKVWQLLTSNYSKANPTAWYFKSYLSNSPVITRSYQAVYQYNSKCFPVKATVSWENTFRDITINYFCQ